MEEHREKGGNPDVDVPYQYLKFFLEVRIVEKIFQPFANYTRATKSLNRFEKTTNLENYSLVRSRKGT